MSRSLFRYRSKKKEDPELIRKIVKLKEKHPSYGVPRVHAVLRREGMQVGRKKVRRLLKQLNMLVPTREKRNRFFKTPHHKSPDALSVNDVWAMDFVSDRLADGSPFRCFTLIDILSREVPGIFASRSMAAFSPVDFLEKLKTRVVLPKHFILDNGPEFANHVFTAWCEQNGIALHFIDPGKPVQNAYIESFNGKFRKEFLDGACFKTMSQVRSELEKWVVHYNEERPHSSLDYLTPKEFAAQESAVLRRKINLLVLKTG